jgi:hypothetical protein
MHKILKSGCSTVKSCGKTLTNNTLRKYFKKKQSSTNTGNIDVRKTFVNEVEDENTVDRPKKKKRKVDGAHQSAPVATIPENSIGELRQELKRLKEEHQGLKNDLSLKAKQLRRLKVAIEGLENKITLISVR